MVRKRKAPCFELCKSLKRRPVKPVSEDVHHSYIFFEKWNEKKSWKRKNEERSRRAVDGTEHTVRTADVKILHRKLLSAPIESQRSPKRDSSPNKHKMRGLGCKYVSASERTLLIEEVNLPEYRPRVRKVDADDENSDLECYDRSE